MRTLDIAHRLNWEKQTLEENMPCGNTNKAISRRKTVDMVVWALVGARRPPDFSRESKMPRETVL
jgi:hypothetical protein